MRATLLLALGILSANPCASGPMAARPLRFAFLETLEMPLGEIQRDGSSAQLTGGIDKDLNAALAHELGRPLVEVPIPRRRVTENTASASFDVMCLMSPSWLGQDALMFDWTPEIMTITERVVGFAGTRGIGELNALKGKTIGTVNGYQYPVLEPLFSSRQATRDDAPSEQHALIKQLARRVDVTVMRDIDLDYAAASHPEAHQLEASRLVITATSIRCLRSPNASVGADELSASVTRLLRSGKIRAILARYGGAHGKTIASP